MTEQLKVQVDTALRNAGLPASLANQIVIAARFQNLISQNYIYQVSVSSGVSASAPGASLSFRASEVGSATTLLFGEGIGVGLRHGRDSLLPTVVVGGKIDLTRPRTFCYPSRYPKSSGA